jgi:hypothetical protein
MHNIFYFYFLHGNFRISEEWSCSSSSSSSSSSSYSCSTPADNAAAALAALTPLAVASNASDTGWVIDRKKGVSACSCSAHVGFVPGSMWTIHPRDRGHLPCKYSVSLPLLLMQETQKQLNFCTANWRYSTPFFTMSDFRSNYSSRSFN